MTEQDVRNYLEKIYKLPVADVRSAVHAGEMPMAKGRAYLVKKADYRLCHVSLPVGMTFEHPADDVFQPENELEIAKTMDKLKEVQKVFQDKTKVGGRHLPTWWSTSST